MATTVEPAASAAAIEVMPCPHCGAALKTGAKFCGKCGNSTAAAKQEEVLPTPVVVEEIAHPAIEAAIELPKTAPVAENKPVQPLPESIVEKTIKSISVQNKTAAVAKFAGSPPVAKMDVPQVRSPVVQVKPNVISSVIQTPTAPPHVPEEGGGGRPFWLIAGVVVLLVGAMGGGAFWWLGKRQAVLPPAADAVTVQPTTAVVTPVSTVMAASETVAVPVVAEDASPASAPSLITQQPVAKPEVPPVTKPVSDPQPKAYVEPKAHEVNSTRSGSESCPGCSCTDLMTKLSLGIHLNEKEHRYMNERRKK